MRNKLIYVALVGVLVQIIGIGWAAYLFGQSNAEGFTFLRNFVSELGSLKYPASARVFGASLILSGLLISPIYWVMARHIGTRLAKAGLVSGCFTTLCVVALGFLPMDFIKPHIVVALGFFGGLMLTTSLFTLAFWRRFSFRTAPLLLLSGIGLLSLSGTFVIIVLLALKAAMDGILGTAIRNPEKFQRPEVWDIAVLEWSVVLVLMIWTLSGCFHLLFNSDRKTQMPS